MQMKTKMRNPMERGAWQAIIHGVARVRHDSETKPPPLHIYYRVKIKKSKMLNITYKPAILSVHPKEMKTQVHKLGCTWKFIVVLLIIAETQKNKRKMNKIMVVYLYNTIWPNNNNKKEWTTDSCMNVKDNALKRWDRRHTGVHSVDSFLRYSKIGTQAKSVWVDKSE